MLSIWRRSCQRCSSSLFSVEFHFSFLRKLCVCTVGFCIYGNVSLHLGDTVIKSWFTFSNLAWFLGGLKLAWRMWNIRALTWLNIVWGNWFRDGRIHLVCSWYFVLVTKILQHSVWICIFLKLTVLRSGILYCCSLESWWRFLYLRWSW